MNPSEVAAHSIFALFNIPQLSREAYENDEIRNFGLFKGWKKAYTQVRTQWTFYDTGK